MPPTPLAELQEEILPTQVPVIALDDSNEVIQETPKPTMPSVMQSPLNVIDQARAGYLITEDVTSNDQADHEVKDMLSIPNDQA